ncbi:halocyanin domain-containing protein [Halorientalis halophila]|uniref:halocyanin domain-containing protein n=1 Tax=Halorientalis halophila TaxID=3108499 RepID=UPI003008DA43
MTDRSADVSRRGFLLATAGGAAASGVAGTAAAQETTAAEGTESAGNETAADGTAAEGTAGGDGTAEGTDGAGGGGGGPPDFGGYLDDANGYSGSVTDATGQGSATVEVGTGDQGFGFSPAGIHVDNGATVQFEWTGEGGAHNVVSDGDGPLDSGSAESGTGVLYEHTFEEDGIYNYYCNPHQGSGMLGSIVVGTDYPTVEQESGGGGGGPALPPEAMTIGVATAVVMSASLGLSYVFMKYGGDYETPE